MPPTYSTKITKKNWGAEENVALDQKLKSLGVKIDDQIERRLGDLTYLECDAFATALGKAQNAQEALETLEDHWKRCILQTKANQDHEATWEERSKAEEQFNR